MPGGAPFSQQELATALSSESLVALFIGTQAEHRYSYETVRVDLMSLRSLAVGLGVPPVPSFSRYVERLLRGYKIWLPTTPETGPPVTPSLSPQSGECPFLPVLGQFSS